LHELVLCCDLAIPGVCMFIDFRSISQDYTVFAFTGARWISYMNGGIPWLFQPNMLLSNHEVPEA
jgi:hypothetical protein